jgi:hypothetical protein
MPQNLSDVFNGMMQVLIWHYEDVPMVSEKDKQALSFENAEYF